jgi:hypothetical protein
VAVVFLSPFVSHHLKSSHQLVAADVALGINAVNMVAIEREAIPGLECTLRKVLSAVNLDCSEKSVSVHFLHEFKKRKISPQTLAVINS